VKPIYLDYNATTPINPEVAQAMLPYLTYRFGNPSSSHSYGREAAEAVFSAREQVAGAIGCQADEIVFTSGGSESNNLAIKGVAHALRHRGNHIVTSAVEHPAVTNVCAYLAANGYRVTTVPVDASGRVDLAALRESITPETILVSVMHANNEVGTIQPLAEICALAHEVGALVHSDCAQSVGKTRVRVSELGVDMLSIAGHKLYGPKGVGALFVRRSTPLEPLIHGADHEAGRRAGTENVAGIVGLGLACQIAWRDLDEHASHMEAMRDALEAGVLALDDSAKINGRGAARLPNTSSISFPGRTATELLARMPSLAASAGAACHSDGVTISSVLKAMGVPQDLAVGTVRFSVGVPTTPEEISLALAALKQALAPTG